ncbi:MAG: family 16 glycosylhydrolase [Bacteroidia bacterium]|nr:family 16 glycosylhydrolase [Bacteroidia bacterium]
MKRIYVFSCILLISMNSFSQVASCVHGGGIQYLLDAYSASMGACNCQKASGFLFSMPPCNNGSYYLAFEDNFDGNSLDLSKWEIQPWGQGALQGSANIEYYSLDNAIISHGTLKITAKKETVTRRAVSWMDDNEILSDGLPNLRTYEYTSSNIWTKKKFFNGKYEIRSRMPNGTGLWPAFWMFGGQRWNEIDVFDNYSGINTFVTSAGFDYDNTGVAQGCNQSYSGYDFSQ